MTPFLQKLKVNFIYLFDVKFSRKCAAEKLKMNLLSSSSNSKPHILLFPFMSKGHTIPLLRLARLLLRRGACVTFITTPANHPFIAQSLSGTDVSILDLNFPKNIPEIPPGVESTEKLPSMSLVVPFVNGTKLMQPFFEEAIQSINPKVDCLISDGFLHWTLKSASKLGIPRLSYYGMSFYAMALVRDAQVNGLISLHESANEQFTFSSFSWIKSKRNDFDSPFNERNPTGPLVELVYESRTATSNSYGLLMNSFYELEEPFVEYWNLNGQPKTWCVGPLCFDEEASKTEPESAQKPKWIHWLDQKLEQGSPVLYIAFGSQVNIPAKQLREIAIGLEESGVSFLWVVRNVEEEAINGFEDRVKGRGIIVREWVDQRKILEHEIVKGFMSHCGWNSVLEAVCAAVPILAWPWMADQSLNAKMVVEEIKIGLRVCTDDGTFNGFVRNKSLRDSVIEFMEGEKVEALRVKAKGLAEAAKIAAAEGGSSWNALNQLMDEICREKETSVIQLDLGNKVAYE